MAYNKVTYKGEVIMDITDSTVTEETLGKGIVAYGANGERIVGTNAGGSGIVEVAELPTENIDTEAFYLCNGEYYRYAEGGNTWVFNDELTKDTSLNCEFAFEFEGYENTKNGTKLSYASFGGSCPRIEYKTDYYPAGQVGNWQSVIVYDYDGSYTGTQGWQKEEYKTITINEMPTDAAFLAWLNANAKPASSWVKVVGVTGILPITQSGEYDVSEYEKAVVDIAIPTKLVIEVDELPTDNINMESIYIYNGELYRCSNTWVFKDVLSNSIGEFSVDARFVVVGSENVTYTGMGIMNDGGNFKLAYYYYGANVVYDFNTNTWESESFKRITFNDAPTDETFLTWLKENATRVWTKHIDSSTVPLVTEVNELPTEDINPKAVYICNGDLYRYNAGDIWVFNETISHLLDVSGGFDVSFRFLNELGEYVDGLTLRYIAVSSGSATPAKLCYLYGFESYGAPKEYRVYDYGTNTWKHENYKTITITSAIEDGEFRTWLEANATCTAPAGWQKYALVTE